MPAKDFGVKHTCWKCSTKFYDLKKATAVCPKCGADPRQAPVVKPAAERKKAREAAVVEPELPEEPEVDEEADEPEEAVEPDE